MPLHVSHAQTVCFLCLGSHLPPPYCLPHACHRSMTTNCIIEPRKSYKDRIFTTGEVRGRQGMWLMRWIGEWRLQVAAGLAHAHIVPLLCRRCPPSLAGWDVACHDASAGGLERRTAH